MFNAEGDFGWLSSTDVASKLTAVGSGGGKSGRAIPLWATSGPLRVRDVARALPVAKGLGERSGKWVRRVVSSQPVTLG